MRALVLDVGSTSVRAGVVDELGRVSGVKGAPLTVRSPMPGEVELDGAEIVDLSLALARAVLADEGSCDVVGVANQRASTVLFDARNGAPLGPVLSWQDLRTVIDCLVLQGDGVRVAPNQSATKARWLLQHADLHGAIPRVGTLESFLAFRLSEGASFVTDHANAGVTGLVRPDVSGWDERTLEVLGLDRTMLAELVPTMGESARATALPQGPPVTALVGDQQASLFGQSCLSPGHAKITFGTGAMLDAVGEGAGAADGRGPTGCFPIVARSDREGLTRGTEAVALTAGSCVTWAVEEFGLCGSPAETGPLAASVASAGGVTFVPALQGLGTPRWDFGARGAFFGLTRGSTRAHLVRALLEGIAHRGADLADAAASATGETFSELRVDGGMTDNDFFVQALADATGRAVAISDEREATLRGAGLMALCGAGAITLRDVEARWSPRATIEPRLSEDARQSARAQWDAAVDRAAGTIPELSSVQF